MTQPYIPRPYQTLITNYVLDHPRSAIWVSMGMGKSAAALQAIDILNLIEPGPTLIVAPLRVARSVWSDEVEKWGFNFRVSKILGTPEERKKALSQSADIFTVNFDNLQWLVDFLGDKWPFTKVVVDEATRLSGYRTRQGTKRAKALGKIAHTKIRRIVLLTGSPAPNGLTGIWGQTFFIDGGERLGKTFTAFSQRWFRKDWSGFNLIPLPHAQKEIEGKLADVCLSLKASDWFDLEKPIVNKIFIDLPPSARKLYKAMEKDLFVKLAKHEVEAFNAASMTVKVQQIANGAIYVDDKQTYEEIHDEKLNVLESVIEEAAGAPILVAYVFKSDLSRLKKAFPKARVLDNNPKTIKDWNAGKISILFAHAASAGHGLNLAQGGNILAFFGISWNLEEHLQIQERIGPTRQMQLGLDRPVFVHYILARNTIDEQVLERLESKRSVQDILLEAMKART